MAETDIRRENLFDLLEILRDHFADDPMVYVAANLMMYYEEGNPKKRLTPDILVVRGIEKARSRPLPALGRKKESRSRHRPDFEVQAKAGPEKI